MNLDAELEEVLRHSGWAPDRIVSVDYWLTKLKDEGFTPLQGATRILSNFGGLRIDPPPRPGALFLLESIVFDPVLAASGEYDRVARWQELYERLLFPLARSGDESIILYSDKDEIVEGWCKHFNLLGHSIDDALRLMVFARTYPKRFSPQSAPNWWES